MPILIPKNLPAYKVLEHEKVFVMGEERAEAQDIRPLKIAILNLMPTKIETETQLARVLGNTPLQINLTFITTGSYTPKNTDATHLDTFYQKFSEVKHNKYDGLIVTGAPVEKLDFGDVAYWDEIKDVFEFAKTNVTSTVFICWGAQAALNYYYGIGKSEMKAKLSGIFENYGCRAENEVLIKGLNDCFTIPHSRYTASNEKEIQAHRGEIKIIARGKECGISIAKSKSGKFFYFFGHCEYDRDTLKTEYLRDIAQGLNPPPPENYFVGGNENVINMSWTATGNTIFSNWLNYYVYQATPFDWC